MFERVISLRKGRIIPGPFSRKFLDQLKEGELNQDSAIELCERDSSPVAKIFRAGLQKWGRPSVEVEQAVLDEGERISNHLRRYLRLINGIATVCPLLGLLGTVLGMIQAFDAIATVNTPGVDQKTLIASGISQALLTTAAGLTVAIPALIAYLFFSSRVDRHVVELDSLGMKVVRAVCAEAQLSKSRGPNRKSAA
jgi:biopolymer transport protein ExbB